MPTHPQPSRTSLTERKQQQARRAIVDAAFELFAEQGFDATTVTEIAARAQVGRTTLFRYFGDKQEILFADEQVTFTGFLDSLRARAAAGAPPADSLPGWLGLLRDCTLARLAAAPSPGRIEVLAGLLADNPELQARNLLKQQQQAAQIGDTLRACGASHAVAALAPQLALACLHAGTKQPADRGARGAWSVAAAFARLLNTPLG